MLSIPSGPCRSMLPSEQARPEQNRVNISNSLQRLCPSADAACLHHRPGSSQSPCLYEFPPELTINPTFKSKSDVLATSKHH